MVSQLAQINMVSGIETLNTTLTSLVDSLGASQSVQAADLIGKTVMVPGSTLTLSDGATYGGVTLASAADTVTVTISDSSGNVLATKSLGAQSAGTVDFSWDGVTDAGVTSTDGTYSFSVSASSSGTAVTATALQVGTVSALTRSGTDFLLNVGTLGTFALSDVQQIL